MLYAASLKLAFIEHFTKYKDPKRYTKANSQITSHINLKEAQINPLYTDFFILYLLPSADASF